jgi:hypothetical protein
MAWTPERQSVYFTLIGLIRLDPPRSATIKEWTPPTAGQRLAAGRQEMRRMSAPAGPAQKTLQIGLIGLIHLDSS